MRTSACFAAKLGTAARAVGRAAPANKGTGGRVVVVVDFDHTLTTPATPQGHEVLLDNALVVSPAFAACAARFGDEAARRVAQAGPEPRMDLSEWWWGTAQGLIASHGVRVQDVRDCVRASKGGMRPGWRDVLELAGIDGVSVVVLSAGMAEVCEEMCEENGVGIKEHPNIHVVSNRMETGADGRCTGFAPTHPIHWANKQQAIANTPAVMSVITNAMAHVVVGDALQDASVLDGLVPEATLVRVGVVKDESKEDEYAKAFDAVLLPGQSLALVADLVCGLLPTPPP